MGAHCVKGGVAFGLRWLLLAGAINDTINHKSGASAGAAAGGLALVGHGGNRRWERLDFDSASVANFHLLRIP